MTFAACFCQLRFLLALYIKNTSYLTRPSKHESTCQVFWTLVGTALAKGLWRHVMFCSRSWRARLTISFPEVQLVHSANLNIGYAVYQTALGAWKSQTKVNRGDLALGQTSFWLVHFQLLAGQMRASVCTFYLASVVVLLLQYQLVATYDHAEFSELCFSSFCIS